MEPLAELLKSVESTLVAAGVLALVGGILAPISTRWFQIPPNWAGRRGALVVVGAVLVAVPFVVRLLTNPPAVSECDAAPNMDAVCVKIGDVVFQWGTLEVVRNGNFTNGTIEFATRYRTPPTISCQADTANANKAQCIIANVSSGGFQAAYTDPDSGMKDGRRVWWSAIGPAQP